MQYVPPLNGDEEDPDRPYVDADPAMGIEGSRPSAMAIEHPIREIVNAIVAGGLVPSGANLSQLAALFAGKADVTRGVPVGAVALIAGDDAPSGWLKLNGAALSRASYPDLWSHASNVSGMLTSDASWLAGDYGKFSSGDGATTFRIPDARGEFLRVWDDGRGADTGRGLGTWQKGSVHSIDYGPSQASIGDRSASASPLDDLGYDAVNISNYPQGYLTSSAAAVVAALGASPSEIASGSARPRNLAFMAIIKY